MRGTQLTVNLVTGQALLGGGVRSQGAAGGRVQARFHAQFGEPVIQGSLNTNRHDFCQ